MNVRLLPIALAAALLAPVTGWTQSDAVQYRPPAGDLAPRRVGGSARGLPEAMPVIAVLVPDHLALTVSERPTLYWYLSRPTTARIELVVVDPRDARPVVEAVVAGERAGIQAFSLAERGVGLEPGVAYEWSVAVVADPAQRSRDVVAGGAVQRVEPSAVLRGRLAGAGEGERAAVLAAEGIWYDALAALSEPLAARPGDASLRARRAAVLEQAGLAEVAAFERRP
ncbi:MAG TPA: DUF928 domain-containing protein [Burkholderiales bacterium]|nr:DUF928 domain-containing protein [Burkholderiales bacterium]